MAVTNETSNTAFLTRSETLLSLALLGVLVVLLIPLPPFLLDVLLTVNLSITILLLLVVLGVTRPLEISVFPSLLLLMTLYRLSLNVATTRLVLLTGDAGRIVSTFGFFVVGGNLVVGLVVFLILVIVQFIVITKGAGRVSEVAARFTLDALPGKQMAIDADVNAGVIDEAVARQRRQELAQEAEFYGAMDGASKFVRGDAIAGLVVTAVNLIGGIILGVSRGLTVAEAARRYSVLTVGDGLVSQIPALVIATAAGILVTKTASQASLGAEIGSQFLRKRTPLVIGAVIIGLLSLTPGLPKTPFLAIAVGLALFVRSQGNLADVPTDDDDSEPHSEAQSMEDNLVSGFLESDRACIEVGTRLIPLVESNHSKGLADRIPGLRQDVTRKHGIWIPPIRIRNSMDLEPDCYRILVCGREVARGDVRPDELLAIPPANPPFEIDGDETIDPTFGLPAKWIVNGNRQRAELGGYTVVDSIGVLVTHLGEVLRSYAHELLSREDLKKLLDSVKETAPSLIEEMKPDVLRVNTLHQVLVHLLRERIPITDLPLILEAVLNRATQTKSAPDLAEQIREDLGRTICDRFRDGAGGVRVIVLEPRLEAALRESLHDQQLSLAPAVLELLVTSLGQHWKAATAQNIEVAVLTDRSIRKPLRNAIQRPLSDLPVIAYSEIPQDMQMVPVAMVRSDEVITEATTTPGDVANATMAVA